MTFSKFDELTRVLATSTSRRQSIKILFASAGGILAFGGFSAALAAGCIPSGKPIPCKHNSDCCSHSCRFSSTAGEFYCV